MCHWGCCLESLGGRLLGGAFGSLLGGWGQLGGGDVVSQFTNLIHKDNFIDCSVFWCIFSNVDNYHSFHRDNNY